MQRNVATTFSITNVSRIAKISTRRLAYWDRIGLVKPRLSAAAGKGSRRLYSFQDIARIKIVGKLRDSGLALQRIRRSFEFIDSLSISVSELVIVTDGETIYVCNSSDVFVDTLKHGQMVLKLIVADLVKEAEEEILAFDISEDQLPE